MNDVERLIHELRWFEDRLTNRADVDFALRNPAGVTLGDLLQSQSDETLAAVVPSGVCRKAVIEELLVVRYGRRLTAWFRRFGADEHTVQDLVQEVCILMLRRGLNRFNPEETFATFLYVVARNRFISLVRRSRRPDLMGGNLEKAGPDLTAQAAEIHELVKRLDGAVNQLPEPDRTIMRLTIDKNSPQEIAYQVGLTATEVSRRLCRTRARVVEVLHLELPPSNRGRPRKNPPTSPQPNPNP